MIEDKLSLDAQSAEDLVSKSSCSAYEEQMILYMFQPSYMEYTMNFLVIMCKHHSYQMISHMTYEGQQRQQAT